MAKEKSKGLAKAVQVKQPNGIDTTLYLDLETGKEVDPSEYDVVDQYTAQLLELGLTTPKKVKEEKKVEKEKAESKWISEGSRGEKSVGGSFSREASNNYGYIDKPGIMNFTNALPGPLGFVSKAANFGINANNKVAVDTARQMLGFDKSSVRGFVKDNKGQVGDVSYNGVTSPVGFEATDSLGRTNLTPNEARMRKELSTNFREAEDIETAQSISQFNAENPTSVPGFAKTLGVDALKGAVVGALGGDIVGGVLGALMGSVKNMAVDKVGGIAANAIDSALNNKTQASQTGQSIEASAENRGLGSLSPSFNAGSQVDYSHPERGEVTKGLTQRTQDVLGSLAANSSTGLRVTSAYRDPATNKKVGGATNSLHMSGDAFDVSTAGLSDKEKRDMVERAVMSGAMEIGSYPDQSLHISSIQRAAPIDPTTGLAQPTGGVTAMFGRTRANYENAPGWFTSGLEESQLAATPTARPETVDTPVGIGNQATANVNLGRIGMFDPETRAHMAQTLAGEIDLSKTDLSTEQGQREAFGILSSMENRVGKYGSISKAISAPNQYSTWNNKDVAQTAMNNYAKNPTAYDSLVDSYAADETKNLGFTSYYNASIANPGWGPTMVGTETIGPHTFGSLSEYSSFGKNFGQQLSQETQQATESAPSGLGTMASANGSISMGQGVTQGSSTANMGGFSSSVSGENANRSDGSSGLGGSSGSDNKGSQGSTGSGSTHGFGGNSGGGYGSPGGTGSPGSAAGRNDNRNDGWD